MAALTIRSVTGQEILPFIPALARLRIAVFRDYPYLYDGSLDYEAGYLKRYASSSGSIIVLAQAGEEVVGASTGLPLSDESSELKAPFVDQGLEPSDYFYCGESVLLAPYRGQGIGHAFFDAREARALALGKRFSCFCAVTRPEDHPLRPAHHRPLDAFWKKRGYTRRPELQTTFSWKDIGEKEATPKPMAFWVKQLSAQ